MKKILSGLGALALLVSCQSKIQGGVPEWPWTDEESRTEWTLVGDEVFGELPDYVRLFQSPSRMLGEKAIAYIAEIDLTKTSFEVWGINAPTLNGSDEPLQTPSQVYDAVGKPCIIVNAGYFYTDSGKSYSSSLEVSNGRLLSPNINYASQDWKKVWYPTRAAFIEHRDGTIEAAWTYWKQDAFHYIYDEPAKNSWDQEPLPSPSADFPCKGREFEAKNAIGGSPLLLKDGKIINSWKEELIEIMADGRHPRTAIGLKADRKQLVLFVCEGRNMTKDVPGYTTGEVAQILLDYGCVDAVNLDGGGSTLMLVNGKETLKPSDGKQRAVASCVYIK